MEPKTDVPKLPDMVMCGDHPSLTKTELNAKEPKDEKERSTSFSKLSPTSSRTERNERLERVGERVERRVRTGSEHALRPDAPRPDTHRRVDAPGNGALVQAALGSFRWPPYLLAVWVLVLVLTHALHCLVGVLERALPRLRQVCQYFRNWAEGTWKSDADSGRCLPIGLAIFTGLLYAFYFALYTVYSIALWSIEPLSTETESKQPSQEAMETKVTDYDEEDKTDANTKQ